MIDARAVAHFEISDMMIGWQNDEMKDDFSVMVSLCAGANLRSASDCSLLFESMNLRLPSTTDKVEFSLHLPWKEGRWSLNTNIEVNFNQTLNFALEDRQIFNEPPNGQIIEMSASSPLQMFASFRISLRCAAYRFGPTCRKYCNDSNINSPLIRYRCRFDGAKECLWGWTGKDCDVPVCERKCYNGGVCIHPDTCSCSSGWTGSDCSQCVKRSGCMNGYCHLPSQCLCEEGWIGQNCNRSSFNCHLTSHVCQNEGRCEEGEDGRMRCVCSEHFSGVFCEVRTHTHTIERIKEIHIVQQPVSTEAKQIVRMPERTRMEETIMKMQGGPAITMVHGEMPSNTIGTESTTKSAVLEQSDQVHPTTSTSILAHKDAANSSSPTVSAKKTDVALNVLFYVLIVMMLLPCLLILLSCKCGKKKNLKRSENLNEMQRINRRNYEPPPAYDDIPIPDLNYRNSPSYFLVVETKEKS
ncbi:hypothetical protein WR25_04754 [Diploscapter pachys]|uniref:Delta-like protein n=1 Tax=Diploscapter pachys TaxID=2018661 RepID=A0A2A2KRP6_9BILA|nr:hypothetical protein WR25_04754 [Diploscapter pachys]